MKLCMAISILVVFASFVCAAPTATDPSVEKTQDGSGWINWDRQVVKAVGHGVLPGDMEGEAQAALMARSAAIADAYRNLTSLTKGVRVSGETYVRNFVTKSDEVRLKVEGFVQGAQIISEKQLPDRSFEIILQMPLVGKKGLISGLAGEILPKNLRPVPETGAGVTGLIIDARDLGIKPAMSPKVYDQDGKEVYGTVAVSPEFAIETGIAAYPPSMEQALKSPRAGERPLVVKAIKKGAKFATDIIVSNRDAIRIREADRETSILARCHVCIVIGSVAKSSPGPVRSKGVSQ